jgi:HEAT repeat protein
MKQKKSQPGDEKLIFDETAEPSLRACAVTRLAADHRREFEPQFARFLEHENELLRCETISALVVLLRLEKYIPHALGMIAKDPSDYVRARAAFAVGFYAYAEGGEKETILRALARAVQQDGSTLVIKAAYEGMLTILVPDAKLSRVPYDIDRERDVDWDLIRPYLSN